MKELWIQNYINKLKIEDVIAFANANQVSLNQEEANFLFITIKENWKILIFGDPTALFLKAKEKLSANTYSKMISLFQFYKQKYQSFL